MKKGIAVGVLTMIILLSVGCGTQNTAEIPNSNSAMAEITNKTEETIEEPPEITISIGKQNMDYVICLNNWDSVITEFAFTDTLDKIAEQNYFIPTFNLGNELGEENSRVVSIDFGSNMPDSVQVFDAMVDDSGNPRYGSKSIMEQTLEYPEDNRVEFKLQQHMAYFLSSNSHDYERDWQRLFQIVCSWEDNKCTYAFLINTGATEKLTEIEDSQFLSCEGSYSKLSSTWGLGFAIDHTKLPENFIIEWQVSDGTIKTWSKKETKPVKITTWHNGYPMTFSDDSNLGGVIWTPASFESTEDVTIKSYIYETEEESKPVAYSEIILENVEGAFQRKVWNLTKIASNTVEIQDVVPRCIRDLAFIHNKILYTVNTTMNKQDE